MKIDVKRIIDEIQKPIDDGYMDCGSYFDPWSLFPCFYGSYSADFDWLAVSVLEGLIDLNKQVWDLPSHMFREVLCTSGLCDYGTSPRACFANSDFEQVLPLLIVSWKEWYKAQWGEEYPETGHIQMVHRGE